MGEGQIQVEAEGRGSLRSVLFAAAATALAMAVTCLFGSYTPAAVAWLIAGVVVCVAGAFLPDGLAARWIGGRGVLLALGACVAVEVVPMIATAPTEVRVAGDDRWYWGMAAVAIFLAGTLVTNRPVMGKFSLVLLAGVFTATAFWLIQNEPNPKVDLFDFQESSMGALLAGHNPYAISFSVPYPQDYWWWYGPGMVVDGKTRFGYAYMPLTLITAIPGVIFGRDVRYSTAVAMGLAGILIGFSRRGAVAGVAAAGLLLMPRTLFVIDQSWTEPVVVLMLAATVWCAGRWPAGMPLALGLLAVSKQYMAPVILLCPLLCGWDRRRILRTVIVAAGVGAVVTLPLALWNWGAFWRSTVMLQVGQPYRDDVLSFLVLWNKWHGASFVHGVGGGAWIGFVGLAVAMGLSLWRLRPSPRNFAAAVAGSYLVFFVFNKQAYLNYYFVVIAALWCAVGAGDEVGREVVDEGRVWRRDG